MSAKAEVARKQKADLAKELAQITSYYRNRVDAFEADRVSFFEKCD